MSSPKATSTPLTRGTTLAYALIAIGAVLLATRFGWLDLRFLFGIARFWPIFLVAAGADMLTRGRHRPLVYGGALAVVLLFSLTGGFGATGGGVVDVAQELEGARAADVYLGTGVSSLNVTSSASAQLLARGRLESQPGEEIRLRYDTRGGRGSLDVRSRGRGSFMPTLGTSAQWQLELSGRVPIALEIDAGVGPSVLDLSALRLESLDIDGGVGPITLVLPASGTFRADIDSGVGETVVRIPRQLGARVTVNTGLGEVVMPRDYVRSENVYTSPGYDAASGRVDLRIDAGVGAVRVEAID